MVQREQPQGNSSHAAPTMCHPWVPHGGAEMVGETGRWGVIVTTPMTEMGPRLRFREQDPSRGEALGQGKELWMRKGFTEESGVCQVEEVWGARGKVGEVPQRGRESMGPWNRTRAKYKGLKRHVVLSNCKYFSIVAWRARGEAAARLEDQAAGSQQSGVGWGGVGWGQGLECWVNVQNLGSH